VSVATVLKLGYLSSCVVLADKVYVAYHDRSETQNEAGMICRKDGGQLATIMDQNEQNHMETVLHPSVSNYWIGATLDFMTQWTWLSGNKYGRLLCLLCFTLLPSIGSQAAKCKMFSNIFANVLA